MVIRFALEWRTHRQRRLSRNAAVRRVETKANVSRAWARRAFAGDGDAELSKSALLAVSGSASVRWCAAATRLDVGGWAEPSRKPSKSGRTTRTRRPPRCALRSPGSCCDSSSIRNAARERLTLQLFAAADSSEGRSRDARNEETVSGKRGALFERSWRGTSAPRALLVVGPGFNSHSG